MGVGRNCFRCQTCLERSPRVVVEASVDQEGVLLVDVCVPCSEVIKEQGSVYVIRKGVYWTVRKQDPQLNMFAERETDVVKGARDNGN